VNVLTQGETYKLLYQADFSMAARRVAFGMMIKTTSGLEVGGASTDPLGQGDCLTMPRDRLRVEIEFICSLNPGTYFMNAGIMGEIEGERTYLARKIDALMFRVHPVTPVRSTGLVNFQVIPRAVRLAS
jgi:lipopolysaccharide transport system ATP-binding protein